ncbi:beta-lactamase family protein [Fulvivirga sp. 29W222]|uniref:Beta-lactamase family protein n=1 Tax=Fulvivirga marina TaxID=2494733 RepID=A0A937FTC9_9BACT|nr:serine hydrolase domain-containing protein [Fulvivirga marina]MBL6445319.1 beta-lactamase family protein [Fulvivirga marina]
MYRFYLSIITTFLFITSFAQGKLDSLTQELNKLQHNSHLTGFAAAIIDKDGIVYAQGFGHANKEKNIPYTHQTVQPIASISKTILAVALMKAQELGKLNLDDNINNHLPFKIVNPNHPEKTITIRHLANHTSGILDGDSYERTYLFQTDIQPFYHKLSKEIRKDTKTLVELYNMNEIMSLEEFIKKQYVQGEIWYSDKHFSKKPPGRTYKYSNMGANIVAYIIEQAVEEDYRNFVQKHILNPLHMDNSGWRSEKYHPQNEATLYWYGYPIPESDLVTYPDGSFMTNTVDYGKFLSTMIQGYNGMDNILSHSSYIEMMKQPDSSDLKKGIFWSVNNTKIGHSGSDLGIVSHAYFLKQNNIGIIVFVNTSDTIDAMLEVRNIYRTTLKYTKQ